MDVFRALVATENEFLRSLLCLQDETSTTWLLESEGRLDSDGSESLEPEDLDRLTRRERAEIAVRVSHAIAEGQIDFGREIGNLATRLLDLRRKLFADSLRLVASIASKRAGALDFSTAILRGAIGLDTAIDRFEPERGNQFSTYSTWWIRHHVTRSNADFSRAIRLPVHVSESCFRFWGKQQEIWGKSGARPPASTVLEEIDIRMPSLEKLMEYRRPTAVARVGVSSMRAFAEVIVDVDVPSPMDGSPACPWVPHAYRILTEHAKRPRPGRSAQQHEALVFVLGKRLSIGRPEAPSLQEIGDELGVSRERIRQLETAILETIRERIFRTSDYIPPWHWSFPG